MRKPILFTSLILGVLLLAPPAFAISFSASALLDLTTLTFSGIPANLTPNAHPSSVNADHAQQQVAFIYNENGAFLSQSEFAKTWVDQTFTVNKAGGGTATALASQTQLLGSINLLAPWLGGSTLERIGLVTATEAGLLTISIDYALSYSGLPNAFPDFGSSGLVGLGFGEQRAREVLGTLPGVSEADQSGTLSLTQQFNAGESKDLFLTTILAGGSVPVPVPDMLLPTLAGLVGVALYAARKQRRERLS